MVPVAIIVPARNEEAALGACLESLTRQGAAETIVVDDGSTDRTRAIAESFAGVRVMAAPALPQGWTGKANACQAGANATCSPWLLFTDADTVHLPGSLATALEEAERHGASMLSYSPFQELRGFAERALMPLIFAELACTFRPREVCDPTSAVAAANGQYLLVTRAAYDAVGGHAAVAHDLLDDVALARLVKGSGRRLRFRFGADAVRTRMYRSWPQMREGWTKNLALLFPNSGVLAARRSLEFVAVAAGATTAAVALAIGLPKLAASAAVVAVPT